MHCALKTFEIESLLPRAFVFGHPKSYVHDLSGFFSGFTNKLFVRTDKGASINDVPILGGGGGV